MKKRSITQGPPGSVAPSRFTTKAGRRIVVPPVGGRAFVELSDDEVDEVAALPGVVVTDVVPKPAAQKPRPVTIPRPVTVTTSDVPKPRAKRKTPAK